MKQIELDINAHEDLLYEIKHTMVFKTKAEHKSYIAEAKAMLVKLQLPLAESANDDRYSQTD
jgi:hypothetical protein